ncbi:uncharacterized protein [Aristolochia californica]|uniref:uncharacterized protein isoform X2 n=1 Tax=Aristolochia californica TaxID=171875 RepID=UPI0035D57725
MSSLLSSQGMALATAMAVSGTVIIFALCRQKPLFDAPFAVDPNSPPPVRNLRSCIASGERKLRKKKKKVHFADHLVEAVDLIVYEDESEEEDDDGPAIEYEPIHVSRNDHARRIPANRLALYNGILQDRLQRMACSY